MGIVVKIVIIQ